MAASSPSNVARTSRKSKAKAREYRKLVTPLLRARQARAAQRNQADQGAEPQLVWRGSTDRSHDSNGIPSPRRQATFAEEVFSKLEDLQQSQRHDRNRQDERSAQSRRQIEELGTSGQAKTEECLQNIKSLHDQSRQDQERTNLQLTTLGDLQQQSIRQQNQLEQTVTTNNQQSMLRTDQIKQNQRQLHGLLVEGFQHVAYRQDQAVMNDQELRQGIEKFAAHLEDNHREGAQTQGNLHRETQHGLQNLHDRLEEAHKQQGATREEYHAELKHGLGVMFQYQKKSREQSRLAHEDDREMTVAMHQEVMAKLLEIANNPRSDSEIPQQDEVSNVNEALGNVHEEESAPQPQQNTASPGHAAGLAARVRDLEERAAAPQPVPEAATDSDLRDLLQRVQELEAAAALHRTQQAEVYLSRIANYAESLAARDPTATLVSAQIDALNANMLQVSSRLTAHDANLATLTTRIEAIHLEPGSNLETASHRFENLQNITQQWESQIRTTMNELSNNVTGVRSTLTNWEARSERATHEQYVQNENLAALIRQLRTALDGHAARQQGLHAEVTAFAEEDRRVNGNVPTAENAEVPFSTLPPQTNNFANARSASTDLQDLEPGTQTGTDTPLAEVHDTEAHFSTVLNMPFTASRYLDCINLLEYRVDLLQMQNGTLQAALEAQRTHGSRFKRIATGIAADFEAIERMRQTINNVKDSAIDSDLLLQATNKLMDQVEETKNMMDVIHDESADKEDEDEDEEML